MYIHSLTKLDLQLQNLKDQCYYSVPNREHQALFQAKNIRNENLHTPSN